MEEKLENTFQITAPGALTTIQDQGRIGYGSMGITTSGAVDQKAMETANILVGNQRKEAVLESTLMGPSIVFHTDCLIAMTGADMQATLAGEPVPLYKPVVAHAGECLVTGIAKTGCRGYIAFAGGMEILEVAGSKSLHLGCSMGGGFGRALRADDVIRLSYSLEEMQSIIRKVQLFIKRRQINKNQLLLNSVVQDRIKQRKIRVIMGPQDDYFTEHGIQTFLSQTYHVSNDSNRMACKLTGQYIDYKETTDIISDGIALGSIQVSSNGQPIIMLTDRQTTGGYAKIATVISVDIPILAQCKPQDSVQFEAVTLREAQRCYRQQEKKMRRLEKKYGLS